MKPHFVLVLQISCFLLLIAGLTSARQVRINRFGKEILFDVRDEEEAPVKNKTSELNSTNFEPELPANVKEIKVAPYPAAGYRPAKAFNLPREVLEQTTTTPLAEFTTSEPLLTTTTADFYETTTATSTELPESDDDDNSRVVKAPYPQSGYRPSKAFDLPNENPKIDSKDAPYPAAGYRPDRAFFLPNEIPSAALASLVDEHEKEEATTTSLPESDEATTSTSTTLTKGEISPSQQDNTKHPVCGVSLNPLRPTPPPGTKDEPDAERVFVPGVMIQPAPVPLGSLVQYPAAQPVLIAAHPSGSYAYSAQFQSWL